MAKLTEEQKAERALKRRRTEALKAEAQALRHEAKHREWAEQGMYLTREEARAGALCRACGLPVVDNLGSWPPLMHLTDEERAEYDAAQAAYRVAHPDCGSLRLEHQRIARPALRAVLPADPVLGRDPGELVPPAGEHPGEPGPGTRYLGTAADL